VATIRKFTEIKAWQAGRELAKSVYGVTGTGRLSKDYGLKDQMQRAAVSVNSNIAEGFERDSNAEFVKFLGYAKGSAGELLSQVITAHDIGYLDDETYENLSETIERISAMLAGFRSHLLRSELPGLRWRTQPETCEQRVEKDFETRNKKLETRNEKPK